ncbi:MAG TPA: MOSC N-terminal beta barrel domain-containing protein [Candidatus Binataceae bacterium]|nr:MOSC N-terminal beta barrel domain-containing protein [Candidatus Binataceae bacterium]
MGTTNIGVVKELYRYPVKSMLGESVDELAIGPGGALGDRAWALRETAGGRIVSAKKIARLFEYRSRYDRAPIANGDAPVTIILPDGRTLHPDDADAATVLSTALGFDVTLERAVAGRHSRAMIDPDTIFGDVAIEEVMPGLTRATMPDSFALLRGSFFDSATIHVLTTGTIAHLRRLAGDDAQADARRFRPNIVVHTAPEATGFVEDGWLGKTLEAGAEVTIVAMQPALRCVMTTHRQDGLPRDLRILRAAAQHHRATLGVFAAIGAPGIVRVGDPVRLAD